MTDQELWDELGSRLRKAMLSMQDTRRKLAIDPYTPDSTFNRLTHKISGVQLAYQYWEEMSREARQEVAQAQAT